MSHNEIQIDIETLGNRPTSAICTIGAVAFDFDNDLLGKEFYINIQPESCYNFGLTTDQDTLDWWKKQSPEAQAALHSEDAVPLDVGMQQLQDFVKSVRKESRVGNFGIWGNDPSFDMVILENAFRSVNISAPWMFWEQRSVRTICDLAKRFRRVDVKKAIKRGGTYHNALDDAKFQSIYTKYAFDLLRSPKAA